MKQKSVGLTLRALILALVLSLVAGTPALPPFEGVAYAQSSGLQASVAPDNSSVTLTWNAVSGADSYEIWRGEVANNVADWGTSAYATVDAPAVTYTDNSVTAGATYAYGVRSVTGGTAAGWTGPYPNVMIGGGTAAPTAMPTVTVAADGTTAADISWTNVAGATSYQIQYWRSDWDSTDPWMLISGNQTSPYKDTGLTPGITYYYVVRGNNDGGMGPWSSWRTDGSTVTLQATTPVPTLSAERVDRTTVRLEWTPTTGAASYDVQRRKITTDEQDPPVATTGSWESLASQTAITYTDSAANFVPTVSSSVMYEYRVRAIDGNGTAGTWSNVVSRSIPKRGAIVGTPGGVDARALSDSSIRVSWNVVTGADHYQLQWKTAERGYSNPITTEALFYEHPGLSPSTQYTYQVRAVDVNGAGDWSIAASTRTRSPGTSGLQMPKVMGLMVMDATSNHDSAGRSAKLTWNAVSDATHYEIQRYDPSTAAGWQDLAETPVDGVTRITKAMAKSPPTYTDEFASGAPGMTYFYVVSAVNSGPDELTSSDEGGADTNDDDNDMGDWSDHKSVTFKDLKPENPGTLSAEMTTGTSIWISWSQPPAVADTSGTATSWTLQWRTDDTSTWSNIPVTGRMTHHHTGLSADTAYRYRVRAENSGGSSPGYSPAGTEGIRVELGNRLTPPTGLRAIDATTGSPGSEVATIKVSWNAVRGASGYEVQRFNTADNMWGDFALSADGAESIDDPATTMINNSGANVAASMTYLYRVRTVKDQIMSVWSAPVSGTTRDPITTADAPVLVATATGMSMIRLSWRAVDGAMNYEVRYAAGDHDADALGLLDPRPMTLPGSYRHYVSLNLTPGKQYSYQVRAVFGPKVMTGWSNVVMPWTKPGKADLTTSNETVSSITLKWNAVSWGDGHLDTADGSNYQIQRRKDRTGDWMTLTLTATTCDEAMNKCEFMDGHSDPDNDDALEKSTVYYYRIRAVSSSETGSLKSYWDYTNTVTPAN
ncbi:MAG: fibronectin type III domain-containing protein [Caldilineaceae bacterium]|nr:fibronectin type III domain-containing protein [Caldilineaceae bacterium]